ncbi:MAG: cysteine desulfurase NifS [Verrucomicrobiae bacterium]|nr:cysteine desulfurase NifS [Verrucomicrobiae bacterium]
MIYLDNNATTRIAPEVFEEMVPYLTEYWGNPSSAYRFAQEARSAMEKARDQVAALLGCEPREIYFTSCGTESDNAALQSALRVTGRRKIVISAVEHSAILNHGEQLAKQGIQVVSLPVDSQGLLSLADFEKAVDEETAICSLMWANNETGVLFPVEELAEICKLKGVLFHTDAVQAVGKIPIEMRRNKIDYLSLSGHKLHAPKGVGALYIRRRVKFSPYLIGGHQEQGKRGGTENVASIVALGRASELVLERIADEQTRVRAMRDRLEDFILKEIPATVRNGDAEKRLPNTTSIGFEGVDAESILAMLDQETICCSSGSACTTGSPEPSHVLRAMNVPLARAKGSLRFSFGFYNSEADVARVEQTLPGILKKLRASQLAPA